MNAKTKRIIFYASTGLLSAFMLFSVSMYFMKNADVQTAFTNLGYPTYLIYPLAIAKLLGVAAIWFSPNAKLKEWAYAGFFFDFLLAFSAHININDGEHWGAVMAMVFLFVSYFTASSR